MGKTKEWVADLSDPDIKAYINRGYGLSRVGIIQSMIGIEFNAQFELSVFPMYALEFGDYLKKQEIDIEDIASFQVVVAAYDEDGNEIDFTDIYEKFAFTSQENLNGYSDSDILPMGNYKLFGSNVKTEFDLGVYSGFAADGVTPTKFSLKDGVGINMQVVEGDGLVPRIRQLVLTSLIFRMKDKQNKVVHTQERIIKRASGSTVLVELSEPGVNCYVNHGYGLIDGNVKRVDDSLVCENDFSGGLFPMFAIRFQDYLLAHNIGMKDITSFELHFEIYDEDGNEMDLEDEYQKCALVSEKAFDGYSTSDILPKGNYKTMGSKVKTIIDLSCYDSSMPCSIEEGVGINIQVLKGERDKMQKFVLSDFRIKLN